MAFPKIDGYVVTEKLGSGSYSTVYKAIAKVGARMTVAIKCVDKSKIKNSGSAVDNLITEIRLMKSLRHPHIVQMHNFTWDDKNIYIIMEYCSGGDLSKYIHRNGRIPERQVLYFLQQLASALKFLSEKGIVHMDLKPHNLLLHKDSDGNYVLKVGDFGFAAYLATLPGGVRGSPLYMAPEVLAGESGGNCDLWSVGVIMYECLFGKAPYSSNTFKELLEKIQTRAPIEIPAGASLPPGCRALLARLLVHDPARRITAPEFFADPYLDLDHMPSKENYEKAVNLIKRAIASERAGDLPIALSHYTTALIILLAKRDAERDQGRRAALTHKIHSYMQRAEEIKSYLSGEQPSQHPSSAADAPSTTRRTSELHPMVEDVGVVEAPQTPQTPQPEPSTPEPNGTRNTSTPSVTKRLTKLFTRQTSLPALDDATNDASKDDDRQSNDTCKIT